MTASPSESLRDPLAAFMAGAFVAETRRPVPLVSTAFAVSIDAGLAVVETTRRFHNVEDESIEATITFPVPVHAVLFSLKARIGERLLTARAESRAVA
ncbi:MAG: VIT domain-containing protein, partial [Reyranella sp.]|nr:VIT domain-containing protein [Reyranella sp.]